MVREVQQDEKGKFFFLFHKIPKGSVEKLGTTTPCAIVKNLLGMIGVDPKGYGSHSMRRGAATAASEAHVKMHVIKRHGRWKSDAVYMYIDDSITQQLSVSQAILG